MYTGSVCFGDEESPLLGVGWQGRGWAPSVYISVHPDLPISFTGSLILANGAAGPLLLRSCLDGQTG